jgi:hypothetical protein
MRDEFVYDLKENLILRKRSWPTAEEIEENRLEEARQQAWIEEFKEKENDE